MPAAAGVPPRAACALPRAAVPAAAPLRPTTAAKGWPARQALAQSGCGFSQPRHCSCWPRRAARLARVGVAKHRPKQGPCWSTAGSGLGGGGLAGGSRLELVRPWSWQRDSPTEAGIEQVTQVTYAQRELVPCLCLCLCVACPPPPSGLGPAKKSPSNLPILTPFINSSATGAP